jgi:hypothetical protein
MANLGRARVTLRDELVRAELRRSLDNPHPESTEVNSWGMTDSEVRLPDEDAESLLDSKQGKSVRWVEGEGWSEVIG